MTTDRRIRPDGAGLSQRLSIRISHRAREALERAADGQTWQKSAQRVLEAWARSGDPHDLLRELAGSGVTHDDHRIDYVEVQIDRATWDALLTAVREREA